MSHIFNNKKIWIGIIAPVFVQLVILFIFIPAIKGMESNVEELSIAVVNEDDQMGPQIAKQLKENLPFKTVDASHKLQAIEEMDAGTYQMIISIPASFTSDMQSSTPEIDFVINQAVPPTVKSSMNQVADQITTTMNNQLYEVKKQNVQDAITNKLTKHSDEQLNEMISTSIEELDVHVLDGKIKKVHDLDGMISSVLPLALFISTFISAMLMVMIHAPVFQRRNNSWFSFMQHQCLNVVATIIFPIAAWIIIRAFDIEITLSLSSFWLFLSLTFWTFTLLAQTFIYLFGLAGQGINAILMLTQAVSSGVIIPITVLPGFYKWLSDYLPGSYYSEGIYSIIFGGSLLLSPSVTLLIFSILFLTATSVIVWIKDTMKTSNV